MAYNFDKFVNNTEANALKEMIFRRVNERTKDINESIQGDIMLNARDNFVSKNNPFFRNS